MLFSGMYPVFKIYIYISYEYEYMNTKYQSISDVVK